VSGAAAAIDLFTIGSGRSSAEHFFDRLVRARARVVVDVRLRPWSRLSGFARKPDLPFLLGRIAAIAYRHEPLLAPTAKLLDDVRAGRIDWAGYANDYLALLSARAVEARFEPASFDRACLMCSEAEPAHCHRRLAAEYLRQAWPRPVAINHL